MKLQKLYTTDTTRTAYSSSFEKLKLLIFLVLLINLPFTVICQTVSLNIESNDHLWRPYLDLEIDSKAPKSFTEVRANCFCVVSYKDLTNKNNRSGTCLDLTGRIGLSFTGIGQQNTEKQNICAKRCSKEAESLSNSERQSIANCACNAGRSNGTLIRAFSAVGNRPYKVAETLGTLKRVPAQYETTCTCPEGWTVDNGQTDPNRKCKKGLCEVESPVSNRGLSELPGFVWDNVIYQWIAGDCNTIQTAPNICRLE